MEGLKVKYNVYKIEDGSIVNNCFVLRPDKDASALKALETYARFTKNGELARDLFQWIDSIKNNKN